MKGPATELIHAGEADRGIAVPLTTPIYETTTFVFDNAQEVVDYNEGRSSRYLYSRYTNPTVVTVEKLYEGNLFDDPTLAAGALGGFYVQAIAVAPKGAWPLALADHYAADAAHLSEYARMAAGADGFAAYLDRHVHAQRAA